MLFIVFLNPPNLMILDCGFFVFILSVYSTYFSGDPIKSLLGDIHIGGGALDVILTMYYPYFNESNKRVFVYTALFVSLLIILGFGSEHKREISNGLFASASFISNIYIRFIFLAVSVYCRSRTAIFIICVSIFLQLKSIKSKWLIVIMAIVFLIYESYLRFQYIDSSFLDSLTTNRFYQWMNIPQGVQGFDVYMSNIKTAKYHNAFVDMRVVSGTWLFSLVWLLFIISYDYFGIPLYLILSFI
ncbi:MAG: hypothetical protein O4859_26940, partial [Trichodesmium sp. St18_bin1]|nr:hypothetical protein [Trichodesmium sp. St18_bin1]